jgi:glycosyltransferase involved in cell wall biosynthesis
LITGKADASIKQQAQAYGVADNLHLTGFLPFEDLPWHLGCADVFVLPFRDSIYNIGRWPNKIGDYMSLARPVVSNAVGEIKPLLEEHRIGLAAQWDAADFAEKIIRLLDDPDLAQQLGQNGRHQVVTRYDWRILIGTLEQFYHRILGVPSP